MARNMPKPAASPSDSMTPVTMSGGGNQVVRTGARNPTWEQVARRAYELFEARGRLHGHDMEDWIQAERELRLVRK